MITRSWIGEGGEDLMIKAGSDNIVESFCNHRLTGRYHLHADEIDIIERGGERVVFDLLEKITGGQE